MRTPLSSHENSCSFVGNLGFLLLEGFIVFFILDFKFHEFVSSGRMLLSGTSPPQEECLSCLIPPSFLYVSKDILFPFWFIHQEKPIYLQSSKKFFKISDLGLIPTTTPSALRIYVIDVSAVNL